MTWNAPRHRPADRYGSRSSTGPGAPGASLIPMTGSRSVPRPRSPVVRPPWLSPPAWPARYVPSAWNCHCGTGISASTASGSASSRLTAELRRRWPDREGMRSGPPLAASAVALVAGPAQAGHEPVEAAAAASWLAAGRSAAPAGVVRQPRFRWWYGSPGQDRRAGTRPGDRGDRPGAGPEPGRAGRCGRNARRGCTGDGWWRRVAGGRGGSRRCAWAAVRVCPGGDAQPLRARPRSGPA